MSGDTITVFYDYVCPFCYLGRKSLDKYQETREEDLKIDWHSFDLQASRRGPDGGLEGSSGMSDEHFEKVKQNVKDLEEEYGAEMNTYDARDIDSFDAQVASFYVKNNYSYDKWLEFDKSIFEALWKEEKDIGDEEVILDLAEEAGIDVEEVREALKDESLKEEIAEKFEEARNHGVSGVPTFLYEGETARGSVPPERFKDLVEK
ncbi:MAG: DsbA family protein [Candidatus Nanohalobium sp.]